MADLLMLSELTSSWSDSRKKEEETKDKYWHPLAIVCYAQSLSKAKEIKEGKGGKSKKFNWKGKVEDVGKFIIEWDGDEDDEEGEKLAKIMREAEVSKKEVRSNEKEKEMENEEMGKSFGIVVGDKNDFKLEEMPPYPASHEILPLSPKVQWTYSWSTSAAAPATFSQTYGSPSLYGEVGMSPGEELALKPAPPPLMPTTSPVAPPAVEGKDDRYKNVDPKMVELIKNEIMDCGGRVDWSNIAGLEFVKETLMMIVVYPLLNPKIFTGLRSPARGILLFGPPGTGKTLIGK
jgi:hypothetical protein